MNEISEKTYGMEIEKFAWSSNKMIIFIPTSTAPLENSKEKETIQK